MARFRSLSKRRRDKRRPASRVRIRMCRCESDAPKHFYVCRGSKALIELPFFSKEAGLAIVDALYETHDIKKYEASSLHAFVRRMRDLPEDATADDMAMIEAAEDMVGALRHAVQMLRNSPGLSGVPDEIVNDTILRALREARSYVQAFGSMTPELDRALSTIETEIEEQMDPMMQMINELLSQQNRFGKPRGKAQMD